MQGFFPQVAEGLGTAKGISARILLSYLLFEALILAQLFVFPKHMCTKI